MKALLILSLLASIPASAEVGYRYCEVSVSALDLSGSTEVAIYTANDDGRIYLNGQFHSKVILESTMGESAGVPATGPSRAGPVPRLCSIALQACYRDGHLENECHVLYSNLGTILRGGGNVGGIR